MVELDDVPLTPDPFDAYVANTSPTGQPDSPPMDEVKNGVQVSLVSKINNHISIQFHHVVGAYFLIMYRGIDQSMSYGTPQLLMDDKRLKLNTNQGTM